MQLTVVFLALTLVHNFPSNQWSFFRSIRLNASLLAVVFTWSGMRFQPSTYLVALTTLMQIWERELWSGPNPARLQHGGGAQPEGGRGQQAAPRSPPLPHSVQGGGRSGASAIRPSAAGGGNTSLGRLALMKTSTGNLVLKLYKKGGGGGT
jgi:hypothetical protein